MYLCLSVSLCVQACMSVCRTSVRMACGIVMCTTVARNITHTHAQPTLALSSSLPHPVSLSLLPSPPPFSLSPALSHSLTCPGDCSATPRTSLCFAPAPARARARALSSYCVHHRPSVVQMNRPPHCRAYRCCCHCHWICSSCCPGWTLDHGRQWQGHCWRVAACVRQH